MHLSTNLNANRPAYLQTKTCYPLSLKDNIPFGQAMKIKKYMKKIWKMH